MIFPAKAQILLWKGVGTLKVSEMKDDLGDFYLWHIDIKI